MWNDDEEKHMIEISIGVGRFEHFEWAHNDSYIVACTSAGLVAVWSRFSGSRLCEYVDKRAHFRTLTGFMTLNISIIERNNNKNDIIPIIYAEKILLFFSYFSPGFKFIITKCNEKKNDLRSSSGIYIWKKCRLLILRLIDPIRIDLNRKQRLQLYHI